MIPFLYILVLLVVGIVYKNKYGYLFNTNFLTTLLWVVFALLAYYNPIGLIPVSQTVHFYALLFLTLYNVTGLFFKYGKHSDEIAERYESESENIIWKRILIITFIALVFYSQMAIPAIRAFVAGDYVKVKDLYYDEEASYFTMYFVKLVPMALMRGMSIASLLLYFKNERIKYLLLSIFLVLIPTVVSVSRVDLFIFLATYTILVVIFKNYKKVSYKPLLLGLLSMFVVSVFIRNNDFVYSIASYFSGSFSFLQHIIDNPVDYGLNEPKHGYMTFAFIFEPVMLVLKFFGITTAKTPIYYFNTYCQPFVNIGYTDDLIFNNNSTILYNFLLDEGVIGIVVGSIFLGIISSVGYKFIEKNNLVGTLIYLYIVAGLFTTTMSYQMFSGLSPLVIILSFIFISGGYNNKKKVKA